MNGALTGRLASGYSATGQTNRLLENLDGHALTGLSKTALNCRVGMTGYTVTPLSEPDWRITHPALWMLSRNQTARAAAPRPVGLGWGGCADTIRWSTKPDVP